MENPSSESKPEINVDADYTKQIELLRSAISRWTIDSEVLYKFGTGKRKNDFSDLFEYMQSPQSELLFQERFNIQSDFDMMATLNDRSAERGESIIPIKEIVSIIMRNHMERMAQSPEKNSRKQIENK